MPTAAVANLAEEWGRAAPLCSSARGRGDARAEGTYARKPKTWQPCNLQNRANSSLIQFYKSTNTYKSIQFIGFSPSLVVAVNQDAHRAGHADVIHSVAKDCQLLDRDFESQLRTKQCKKMVNFNHSHGFRGWLSSHPVTASFTPSFPMPFLAGFCHDTNSRTDRFIGESFFIQIKFDRESQLCINAW